MRAMIMCSALFAALSLLAPVKALSDTWDDCKGTDTKGADQEKAVAACTKLIDRGRLNPAERANAYHFRALGRLATKNFEGNSRKGFRSCRSQSRYRRAREEEARRLNASKDGALCLIGVCSSQANPLGSSAEFK